MGARISSILRKAKDAGVEPDTSDEALVMLNTESEWSLIKDLERYPSVVARSADTMDPSIMAAYVYDVCKSFSAFYRDCPILSVESEQPKLARARLALAECTLTVLKTAMELVLVPFVERM